MLNREYSRDLVMIGAIFGLAAFVWSGWAQQDPPEQVTWRIVLGVFSAVGLALIALLIPVAIRYWHTPTAIDPSGRGFKMYVIVFWAEVVVAVVLAIIAVRAGHSGLIAPLIMVVVGVHFFALAVSFGQPVLHIAAILLTLVGIAAWLIPTTGVAPSFCCGILGAPIFLAISIRCYLTGRTALRAG